MTRNSWTGNDRAPGRPSRDSLADSYARHTGTLRGAVRQALVTRALVTHMPTTAQRILDVGGGSGHQAIALARAGHEVVILDPDEKMLEVAQANIAREDRSVRARVRTVLGRGEDSLALVGGHWDVTCCHGVLMYLPDAEPLAQTLVEVTRTGGIVSVLTKNAATLALRPALEGRWADAISVLDGATEIGRLGVATRADTLNGVHAILKRSGASPFAWYGVRVAMDHLGDTPVGNDFDLIVDFEWAAGQRDPLRQIARLIHVLVRRDEASDLGSDGAQKP